MNSKKETKINCENCICDSSQTRYETNKVLAHVPVNGVGLCLCWVLNVRLIQQLLDAQQDLRAQATVLQLDLSVGESLLVWTPVTPPGSTQHKNTILLPKKTAWLGVRTCLMVMAGLQSLSSSRMDRHTVPDG